LWHEIEPGQPVEVEYFRVPQEMSFGRDVHDILLSFKVGGRQFLDTNERMAEMREWAQYEDRAGRREKWMWGSGFGLLGGLFLLRPLKKLLGKR
jgi:hypothetical protein